MTARSSLLLFASTLFCFFSLDSLGFGQLNRPRPNQPLPNGPAANQQNQRGPWNNDIIVYKVATGAAPEKLHTFERAGVSTVVRLKDGRLQAAFQHFPANDEQNFDKIATSFSEDEGKTWTKPKTVKFVDMDQDLVRPFDPTLLLLPDGRIRMYFTSNRTRNFRRSAPAIYSAISDDGEKFTFETGTRFGVADHIIIDCAAAFYEGKYHLIVPDNGSQEEFLRRERERQPLASGKGYHAISEDGLTFERVDDVEIDSRSKFLGCMVNDGQELLFFGTGPGQWPLRSTNGKSWQFSREPIGIPGADPGAVQLKDGTWLLVVTGMPRGQNRPNQ